MAQYTGLDGNACTPFNVTGGIGVCGGFTDCDLVLDSLNPMTFQIGGVDSFQMDESSITGFAGAATVAGHAVFMGTEDGGAATTETLAGGLWSMILGNGSQPSTSGVGGAGGAVLIDAGDGAQGADCVATPGIGGVGGAWTMTAGAGGAGGADSDCAGTGVAGAAGGAIVVTTGIGGAGGTAPGCGTGGVGAVGGAYSVTSGAGGLGGSVCGCSDGNSGNGGAICIVSGAGGAVVGGGCAGQGGVITVSPGGSAAFTAGRLCAAGAVQLSFYGAAVVSRAGAIADPACCTAANNTAIDSILTALRNVNLIAT